jgi:hypothetical protein
VDNVIEISDLMERSVPDAFYDILEVSELQPKQVMGGRYAWSAGIGRQGGCGTGNGRPELQLQFLDAVF